MENQEKNNELKKSILENPKPTDEVQLEIETVTPETERHVQPTTPAEKNNIHGTDVTDEDKQNDVEEEPAKQTPADELKNEENQTAAQGDKDEDKPTVNPQEDDKTTDEGDERDKIETVAP